MRPLNGPEFPGPGVWLPVRANRFGSKGLKAPIERVVAARAKSFVVEQLRCGHDDRPVYVVLSLVERLVADAHRPHAAKSAQIRRGALHDRLGAADSVDRPHSLERVLECDVLDESEKAFHRPGRTKAVERLNDKECISEPAVPVVPRS